MKIFISFFLLFAFCFHAPAQNASIEQSTLVRIVRAEDERRFDRDLQSLLESANAAVRRRAALAAGRIGGEGAVNSLAALLEKDRNLEVRQTAAFALGEIESVKAAAAILRVLQNSQEQNGVRARAIEAAGKIAAANSKDAAAKDLSEAVLDALEAEHLKPNPHRETILLGLTAVLRARGEDADKTLAKFLTDKDERIRADALNSLARLRAKNENANAQMRALLMTDNSPIVRANAARALGAAEDKQALNLLIEAAANDDDLRVRVQAVRSLAALKDKTAAASLLARGEKLFAGYKNSKTRFPTPTEKNELLEVATTLGKLLLNSNDIKTIEFLKNLREFDRFGSPETEIAFAQIAPKIYLNSTTFNAPKDAGFGLGFYNSVGAAYYISQYSQATGTFAQGLAEIANNKAVDAETIEKAQDKISYLSAAASIGVILLNPKARVKLGGSSVKNISAEQELIFKEARNFNTFKKHLINGFPDVLRTLAKLKPKNYENEIVGFLLNKPVFIGTAQDGTKVAAVFNETESEKKEAPYKLLHQDPIVRATAAELVGEIENVKLAPAMRSAFEYSVGKDTEINDAQLAILEALDKQYKKLQKDGASASSIFQQFKIALDAPDYLVRRRAAQLIKENNLAKEFPSVEAKVGTVKPHNPATGTKLGQIFYTEADYARAVSRKNGEAKAVVTTEKGAFEIEFFPEDAPLAVDNFIRLARSNYFNNVAIHRVVPNFVVQDGDPRGDGNGSPGWQIRCEINQISYERGMLGMALSGKDTGGSQWFLTHSPQPHLDGGYTVFGRVNEAGMKIVDNLARGDKILMVRIVEKNVSRQSKKSRK